jgi:hypothetical protein
MKLNCKKEDENLIKFITTELQEYTKKDAINYLLNSRDNWTNKNVLKKCDLLKDELENFDKILNPFEKDIYLKLIINKIYNHQTELNEWIVKDWGGISTHKNFDTLQKSKDKRKFDRISSWSKLLSFENIEEDIIYDSRVIYSLNWLIYKYNKYNNKQEKYLFQPEGRNKKLSLLPVNSIIYFEYSSQLKEKSRGDNIYNDIFIKKDHCYNYAKKMILDINKILFENIDINILSNNIKADKYPFFTEMILFEIADKEVFDDIKSSINIQIKDSNEYI